MKNEGKNTSEVLAEIFERHDAKQIASALHIPVSHVYEWHAGTRRNPLEAAAVVVETLRATGNPDADEAFLTLARRLGFIAYRPDEQSIDDVDFANVLRDFSDLMHSRAEAERDGKITPDERREMAARAAKLIERAAAYRDAQLARASADEQTVPIRRHA